MDHGLTRLSRVAQNRIYNTMQEFPLDAKLRRIETALIAAIPDLIRNENLTKRAYGILLCYIDYTSDSCTPFVCVLPESHRTKCVTNRNVADLWTICSVPGYGCSLPNESPIHALCRDVYSMKRNVKRNGWDLAKCRSSTNSQA